MEHFLYGWPGPTDLRGPDPSEDDRVMVRPLPPLFSSMFPEHGSDSR